MKASRVSLARLLLFVAPCLCCGTAFAQEPEPYTLHVYTNLLQIPVLILNADLEKVPSFRPQQLSLRLDNGKPFHPTLIRREGDDPLTIAILLDMSGSQKELLPYFKAALQSLAPPVLNKRDKVVLYGLGCRLVEIGKYTTPDTEAFGLIADKLLAADVHQGNSTGACGRSKRIFDAMAAIALKLSDEKSSRRVLLAITNGIDGKSRLSHPDVRRIASQGSVAIFALSVPLYRPMMWERAEILHFDSLCESTGGIHRSVAQGGLTDSMQRFVAELRDRYIIEFPRPRLQSVGEHIITVDLAGQQAFLRSAGISVPLPSPEESKSNTTIDPDVKHDAPELGSERPVRSKE